MHYDIYYKRTDTSKELKIEWVKVWYSPPHNGGKFKLPKKIMELHPVLGEFTYLKMMGAKVLEAVNRLVLDHFRSRLEIRCDTYRGL